ncbi:MAG: hypothetical protein OQL19_04290 [Gammaproteobacteria bacterium]|nr:hypothetical protein [Gammaproteobacteria bacterium]
MCSTPRFSRKAKYSRTVSTSSVFHSSYSQMMRSASLQYEQRQKELTKRRQRLLEKERLEEQQLNTSTD